MDPQFREFVSRHAYTYAIDVGGESDEVAQEYAKHYLAVAERDQHLPNHPNVYWEWVKQFKGA